MEIGGGRESGRGAGEGVRLGCSAYLSRLQPIDRSSPWQTLAQTHNIRSCPNGSLCTPQPDLFDPCIEDEALLELTNELETRRDKLLTSFTENLARSIWEFNEKSTTEIKVLTSRLVEFLEDIKTQLTKINDFGEIIPSWKDKWDACVDQWSCDVRDVLWTLKRRIVEALRSSEYSIIESRKFTAVQVEKFLNHQVTKLNHLIIVNERTYSETERQLKLVFDALLHKWLISYSYQEIAAAECQDIQGEEDEAHQENTLVFKEIVKIVENIIAGLENEEPSCDHVSALKVYLDHLRLCQHHVKLHLKEALLHLKNHLLERQEYPDEEEHVLQLGILWTEIVNILKEQYDEFGNYSKQMSYAWNQFLRRVHCAEHTAAIAISKTRAAMLTRILVMEEKMNRMLDQLREGNNVSNLESVYQRIIGELENAELSYLSCREGEDEVMRNLIAACFSAYDIYCVQLNILHKNRSNADANVDCVEVDLDDANGLRDLELIRMQYCVYSAQTWIQGLLGGLHAEKAKSMTEMAFAWAHLLQAEGLFTCTAVLQAGADSSTSQVAIFDQFLFTFARQDEACISNSRMKETVSMLEAELPEFLKTLLENVVSFYKGESECWLMLQLEKLTRRKKSIRLNVLEIRAEELKLHDTAQKHFHLVVDNEVKRIKELIKKTKDDLTQSDTAVVKYLEETKTDKLEDTPEKKMKHLKDDVLITNHELARAQIVRKGKYEIERVYKWLQGACFSYACSLKLFHEGGNYSAEECEQVVRKLTHHVKRLNKDTGRTVKKIDHVLSGTKDSFMRKLSKIVYPEPSSEALFRAAEREATDRLNIHFNRLKEMIKIETYKAIRKLNYLKETMASAERAISFQKWHEAINAVESLGYYFDLSKRFPILELSIVLGMAQMYTRPPKTKQGSLPEISSSVLRRTRRKRSAGSKVSLVERRSIRRKSGSQRTTASAVSIKSRGKQPVEESLFVRTNAMDENNYLSTTKSLIDDVHSRVKLVLADAYQKYNVPIENSHLQREHAVSTLKYYNLQCESVWTQLFDEYMNILLSLCRNILSYVLLLKDRLIYQSVNRAMKLKSDHKLNLAKLNVTGLKEKIDSKLKPSHGYPLNKPLLQSLLKDVVAHCKEQLNSRKTVNDDYKEQLKTLVAEDKAIAVDTLESVKFFFLELYSNSAYQSLLENVCDYTDSKEFGQSSIDSSWLVKSIQDYCSTFWPRQTTIETFSKEPQDLKPAKYEDIGFNFLADYKFWSFLPHMRNTLRVLRELHDEFQVPNLKQPMDEKPINFQRSIEYSEEATEELDDEIAVPLWLQFKEDMNKHVQDFEATAIKNLTLAKKEFDSVAGDLTRWKSEWISNIKEVNRLYLINPILDPPPKKIASNPAEYLTTAAFKKAQENEP